MFIGDIQNTGRNRERGRLQVVNNLIYADDTTVMAEGRQELKSLLMKVKEESEKFDLKLNSAFRKTKIIGSSSTISWQIEGGKWKQGQILFSWAPKSL